MPRFLLALLRLCLGAWVGVGCFFVAVIIALRRSDLFEETAKLNHAKVLFPLYYWFLFSLVGAALVAGVLGRSLGNRHRLSESGAAGVDASAEGVSGRTMILVVAVLILALVDWYWIYVPLLAMIHQTTLPASFTVYHRASMWINAANLLVSLAATWSACMPAPRRP